MLLEIDCPHHKKIERLDMPENFLGETLCHPDDGGQAQPLRMKIVEGKIQEIWGLPPEPPVDSSLEQQVAHWKAEARASFRLWLDRESG